MGSLGPVKRSFLHAFGDGGHKGAKPLDESSIKRCQAMETPNFDDGGASFP